MTNYAIVGSTPTTGNTELCLQQYDVNTKTWTNVSTPQPVNLSTNPPTCPIQYRLSDPISITINGQTVTIDLSEISLQVCISLYSQSLSNSNQPVPANADEISAYQFAWFDTSTQQISYTGTYGTNTISGTITIIPIMNRSSVVPVYLPANNSTPGALALYLSNYESLINGSGLTFAIITSAFI